MATEETHKGFTFSMRHGALLSLSVLSILLGATSVFWAEGMEPFAPVFFLLAIVFTVILGMVPSQKYFAFVWPLLFLLIGLLRRNDILLPTYLLFGLAFSTLFLSIRTSSDNQIKFSFFPVTIPGVKIFYLLVVFGLAFGIYMGLPTEQIQQKIETSLNSVEKISFPGMDKIVEMVNSGIQTALTDSQSEFSREQIEQQADQICGDDTVCKEETTQRIQEEITARYRDSAIPEIDSDQMGQQMKGVLQSLTNMLSETISLNAVLAILFLLALLPFTGIFALLIGSLVFLFFRGLAHTGLIEIHEQEVRQRRYV